MLLIFLLQNYICSQNPFLTKCICSTEFGCYVNLGTKETLRLVIPQGRRGISDVSPLSGISGLSFDSTVLSSLLFFCLVLLLSVFFFFLQAHSPELFHENSAIFFVKRYAFLYGSCLAVRRRQLVGGMCSMLPYDTGICCYAFI